VTPKFVPGNTYSPTTSFQCKSLTINQNQGVVGSLLQYVSRATVKHQVLFPTNLLSLGPTRQGCFMQFQKTGHIMKTLEVAACVQLFYRPFASTKAHTSSTLWAAYVCLHESTKSNFKSIFRYSECKENHFYSLPFG